MKQIQLLFQKSPHWLILFIGLFFSVAGASGQESSLIVEDTGWKYGMAGDHNIEIKVETDPKTGQGRIYIRKHNGAPFGSTVWVDIRRGGKYGTVVTRAECRAGAYQGSVAYDFRSDFSFRTENDYGASLEVGGFTHLAGDVTVVKNEAPEVRIERIWQEGSNVYVETYTHDPDNDQAYNKRLHIHVKGQTWYPDKYEDIGEPYNTPQQHGRIITRFDMSSSRYSDLLSGNTTILEVKTEVKDFPHLNKSENQYASLTYQSCTAPVAPTKQSPTNNSAFPYDATQFVVTWTGEANFMSMKDENQTIIYEGVISGNSHTVNIGNHDKIFYEIWNNNDCGSAQSTNGFFYNYRDDVPCNSSTAPTKQSPTNNSAFPYDATQFIVTWTGEANFMSMKDENQTIIYEGVISGNSHTVNIGNHDKIFYEIWNNNDCGSAQSTNGFFYNYRDDAPSTPQGTVKFVINHIDGRAILNGQEYTNNQEVRLNAGMHTFSFKAVTGKKTPQSQTIEVTSGGTITIIGTYEDDFFSSYPYKDLICACDETCGVDEWSFYKKQCVSFVAWYINNLLGERALYNSMFGSGGSASDCSAGAGQRLSNACRWANIFEAEGVIVDTIPKVNDILWFPANVAGYSGSEGHVEIVVAVNGNTITTKSYNAGGNCQYLERDLDVSTITNLGAKFIHFIDWYSGGGNGGNPPEPTEFGLYGETIETAPNTSGSAYFLVKNMGSLTNFGYEATVTSTNANLTITNISSPSFPSGFAVNVANGRVSHSIMTTTIPEGAQLLKVDFEVGNAPIGEEILISLEDLMVINPTTWEMIDAQTTPIKITVKEPKFDLTINIESSKSQTFNGNLKITESGSTVFEETTDNGTAIVSLDADKTYNVFISRQEPSLTGLNIADVARTQAFSLGMIPLDWKQQLAADVDGNGLITIRDVMLIQGKTIGKPMPSDANFDYVFVQNLDYSGTAISDIPTSTDVLMDVNQVLDFIVIRRGDLDHSGFPNTSNGKIEIEQIPFSITENEEFIEIKAVKNISLTGLDLRTKNGTNFKSNLLNFTENDVFQNRLSYAPQNTTDFQAGDLVVKFQGSTQDLKLEISNERFHLANGHLEFNKADANLVVYPNPSNNGIFNLVGLPFEAKISVWDTTGKKLLSSNTVSKLDLSSFESGIYILKIQTNNTTFTKKIILH